MATLGDNPLEKLGELLSDIWKAIDKPATRTGLIFLFILILGLSMKNTGYRMEEESNGALIREYQPQLISASQLFSTPPTYNSKEEMRNDIYRICYSTFFLEKMIAITPLTDQDMVAVDRCLRKQNFWTSAESIEFIQKATQAKRLAGQGWWYGFWGNILAFFGGICVLGSALAFISS